MNILSFTSNDFTKATHLDSSEEILEAPGQRQVHWVETEKAGALEAFGDPAGPKVRLTHRKTSSEIMNIIIIIEKI